MQGGELIVIIRPTMTDLPRPAVIHFEYNLNFTSTPTYYDKYSKVYRNNSYFYYKNTTYQLIMAHRFYKS